MVQLIRSVEMSDVFGFVVDSTEDLILVHFFDSEAFCLTGYDVLRHQDVRSYCFFDDPRYWRFRALRRLKIRPRAPVGISLASMPELLASVARIYPLLSVHQERRERSVTYVGPIVSLGKRIFTIEDSNHYGEWTGRRRMRYDDVTRVCFDGGYLRAAALTAQKSVVKRD
ncbi:MAG: hypothetical protein JWN25_1461 [Verrucomicrobiales bacterium]|nr:hypothetical protein [Verrucomicrobiales bacterium]